MVAYKDESADLISNPGSTRVATVPTYPARTTISDPCMEKVGPKAGPTRRERDHPPSLAALLSHTSNLWPPCWRKDRQPPRPPGSPPAALPRRRNIFPPGDHWHALWVPWGYSSTGLSPTLRA